MPLAPTPRDTVLQDGPSRLYRFRRPQPAAGAGWPLLLVPSLINRWYVLDLRPGASLAEALTKAGVDAWCLDWGVSGDEDRYFTWDDVLARLRRAVRQVQRRTGAPKVGLLGYCVGGTLCGIHAALEPDSVAGLINLAGPFDFSQAGFLGEMTNAKWFDPQAIADAGNVHPLQMQSGFQSLRPTGTLAKWVSLIDRGLDPDFREAFNAMEEWASDNIPFPGAAYARYVKELYQENQLVRGEHRIAGRAVDLAAIRCPLLSIVADKDTICPPNAAQGLNQLAGAKDKDVLVIPGGHVGAVVGSRASKMLYPALIDWLRKRQCISIN